MIRAECGAGYGRHQRHRVLVAGDHIMQLGAERAARQLEDPGEHLQYLLCALVVPRDGATAGNVVADVFGPELPQCVHVASPEGRACLPHQVFVRMCHLSSPSS
jgi:hypothetical protein